MKNETLTACLSILTIIPPSLFAATADFSDTTAYITRQSGDQVATVISDSENETYTVTANGGGKVSIGFDALIGNQVGTLANFKFTSEGSITHGYPYMNFWVTDGANYAMVTLNEVDENGTKLETPVYEQLTSAEGVSRDYFQSLQVRVYATDYTNLDWLYQGAIENKYTNYWHDLWKSDTPGLIDPVTVADIAHLTFASPFDAETSNLPSVSSPEAWPYAGTGEPQLEEAFYVVVGDTSGNNTGSFVLGGFDLQYDSAAQNTTTGSATASTTNVDTGTGTVSIGGNGTGYYATDNTDVEDEGTLEVTSGSTFQTKTINTGILGTITLVEDSKLTAEGGEIAGTLALGTSGAVEGGSEDLVLSGDVNGSGTLKNLTITGNVSVGNSPGVQNYEGVIFGAGATILMEIEGTDPSEYDRIIADLNTDFSGADLTIVFSAGFTPEDTDIFDLFSGDAELDFASIVTPEGWTLDDEGRLVVPEPSTFALALGLAGLLAAYRRRRG